MSILCPHCHSWRYSPTDRFCGRCGEILLQTEVTIQPVTTIYQGSVVPPQLTVVIRNVHGGLGGTTFFWRNPANGQTVPVVELDSQALLQPHEQEIYTTASIALGLSTTILTEWQLIHKVAIGKEYTRATLRSGVPLPQLTLAPAEILLANPDKVEPLVLTLSLHRGNPVSVKNLTISASDAVALDLSSMNRTAVPFSLSSETPHSLTLEITKELLRALQTRPRGLQLLLAVQIKDISTPVELPFKLQVSLPARPVLTLPPQIKVLQGRRLQLPVRVENQGGHTCRLKNWQVIIRLGPSVLYTYQSPPGNSHSLAGGDIYTTTLPIPLLDAQGQPLSTRGYQCDVQLQWADENQLDNSRLTKLTIQLNIRPLQEYTGLVAIDFGTAATATAYSPPGQMGQSALPIPLSETEGGLLPTAIAYYLDEQKQLQYCIGEEAIEKLNQEKNTADLVYLDNLKWRLDDLDKVLLPDGSERTWVEITADYLRQIKERIEESMDLVALVNQVVITQPSRFHPMLRRALHQAYSQAGLQPLEISLGNVRHPFLAESWPALTTCLPLQDLKNFQSDTVGYNVLGDELMGQKWAILTYDVGGGSTDISLFLLEINNMATMQVTELGTDGTGKGDYFFGNGFSELLFKHLRPACERWLIRQGYDPNQFPIILPWQPRHPGLVQTIGRENGQRCLQFVLEHLQHEEGPFKAIASYFSEKKEVWEKPNQPEFADLLNDIQKEVEEKLASTRLSLQSVQGAIAVNIPGGRAGVFLDFKGFLKDFIDTCSRPMLERLQRLLQHPQVKDLTVYWLETGRGARFPLVSSMLAAHLEQLCNTMKESGQPPKLVQVRVARQFAKSIVSQGACYLAKLAKAAPGMVFHPCTLPAFGFQGPPDPQTGKPQFIPLCTGLPTPADGWQVAAYPLPPGPRTVQVNLYLNLHHQKVLSADDKWLGEVSQTLDLQPEEAARTYVMVKAKAEGCLEVYLGISPEAETDQKNYEGWKRHWVGECKVI